MRIDLLNTNFAKETMAFWATLISFFTESGFVSGVKKSWNHLGERGQASTSRGGLIKTVFVGVILIADLVRNNL